MFVKKENTQILAEKFVGDLKSRKVDKPMSEKDKFHEELALKSFKRYVGSVSCAMSYRRAEQFTQKYTYIRH